MNRLIRKITVFLMALILVNSLYGTDACAAGGLSISSSASKVTAGGTFTVTVKAASNYFVADLALSVSGGTVVSGLGKSSLDSGESTTAQIKLTGDSCTVKVSGTAANYETETEGSASASVTVTKKAEATTAKKEETTTAKKEETTTAKKEETTTAKKNETTTEADTRSGENRLSSLSVSEGTLSPAFAADTTSYRVELPGNAESIAIQAAARDKKASVSGTGTKTLDMGENIFKVVCKAENGSTKTYTITVYVDESPLVYTSFGEEKLGVVRNLDGVGIPATFEETTVTLEGQEVKAFTSGQFGLTLVYLENEAGEEGFYIIEEEKGIVSRFRSVSILGKNVVLYDLTEEEQEREHMEYGEMQVDGVAVWGWTYTDAGYENYAHIPVINEFGQKVIYQWEKTENCLQLYSDFQAEEVEVMEEPDAAQVPENLYLYIAIGAAAFFFLLTLIQTAGKSKLKKKLKNITE